MLHCLETEASTAQPSVVLYHADDSHLTVIQDVCLHDGVFEVQGDKYYAEIATILSRLTGAHAFACMHLCVRYV